MARTTETFKDMTAPYFSNREVLKNLKLAIFAHRGPASFRNQSGLLYKAGIQLGYEVEERDISQRAVYPTDQWDRIIVLVPLWPRYVFDAVRLSTPWFSKKFTLYGPVDGPYMLNVTFLKVVNQLNVITTSQFCREAMIKSEVKVNGVVYHGIDPRDFKFSDSPKYDRFKQLRAKHPGKTIFFSNLNPIHRKGFKHLSRALQILSKKRPRDFVFILHTGRGDAMKHSPDLAKIPGLVIEDAYNQLPFRQIALKTASCDVFVFPSLLEGFGLPVLEAAAAGRPIVCCDMAPLTEILRPDDAWWFPYQNIREEEWQAPGCRAQLHEYDPADLARAMETAMDHPKESAEKAKKAQERSRAFHYMKVYKPLLKG